MMTSVTASNADYFHRQSARATVLPFLIIGLLGLVLVNLAFMGYLGDTLHFQANAFRWIFSVIFGMFILIALPVFVRGGTYGSQIAHGRFAWHTPSNAANQRGDIAIADIQRLVARQPSNHHRTDNRTSSSPTFHLELHSGESFEINQHCIRNIGDFAETLYRLNPDIRFESEGFTMMFAGNVPWTTV